VVFYFIKRKSVACYLIQGTGGTPRDRPPTPELDRPKKGYRIRGGPSWQEQLKVRPSSLLGGGNGLEGRAYEKEDSRWRKQKRKNEAIVKEQELGRKNDLKKDSRLNEPKKDEPGSFTRGEQLPVVRLTQITIKKEETSKQTQRRAA